MDVLSEGCVSTAFLFKEKFTSLRFKIYNIITPHHKLFSSVGLRPYGKRRDAAGWGPAYIIRGNLQGCIAQLQRMPHFSSK